ncbi:MAG: sodium:calcium symporter [Opitutales bacterium]
MAQRNSESWNSRVGIILAVAGSAVGLGNFLRFPGQAAEYGGGAFMIAYFISFLLIGLPICWAEWAMGRMGGQAGFNSAPGIFNYITRRPAFKHLGAIGVLIPVVIYMYYVYIEAWCLGYAVNFLRGDMQFGAVEQASAFWQSFIGIQANGSAIGFGWDQVGCYLVLVFVLNFILIFRGISKGIELFCRYAMPALVLLAFVILFRVLTLGVPDPNHPERSVQNGLGFMWNPTKQLVETRTSATEDWVVVEQIVDPHRLEQARSLAAEDPHQRVRSVAVWEQLANPQLWLAAAGQIFFSLSVGFGVIITYASYLRKKDDVVLSGLAATSANEFCEVAIGGLITLPAAVTFLGVAGVAGMGTFGLGFNVLPMVFSNMAGGEIFGFLFFFLLFLAAVTSSLSMLQPGIAFLEESLNINRKQSVTLLGFITALGCGFVVYFSQDAKALDTLDFWVGTCLIFILASIQIIIFSWVLGVDKGIQAANTGSSLRIPPIFAWIMKYVSPSLLIIIFIFWLLNNVFGFSWGQSGVAYSTYIKDLFIEPNRVAQLSILLVGAVATLFVLIIALNKNYSNYSKKEVYDD